MLEKEDASKYPRYVEGWKKPGDLEAFKKKILYGVADDDAWRYWTEKDLKNIFRDDFRMSPDDVILEFGCGVGRLIKAIAEKFNFRKLVGLDVNPQMVEYAQQLIQDPRVSFTTYAGGVTLPFESNTFDKIYSVLTIQHIDKHYAYFIFQDMLRILKPGGKAVLQVENWAGGKKDIIESCIYAAKNYVMGVNQAFMELYNEGELRHIFNDWLHVDDLKIEEWVYTRRPPIYYRLVSRKPFEIHYRIIFRKPLDWPNKKFSYLRAFLDRPVDNEVVAKFLEVSGWTFSWQADIEEIIVEIDGKLVRSLSCDLDRPDVARDYPTVEGALRSGFKTIIDAENLSTGEHKLCVRMRDQFGNEEVFVRKIQIRTK